jgi:hypothetical protein
LTLPPGWIGVTAGRMDINGQSGWCWAAMILPQLEQQNIFRQMSFLRPITDPANSAVYLKNKLHAQFRNPNDTGPEKFTIMTPSVPGPATPICDLPTSNYVGNWGTTDADDCYSLVVGQQCIGNGVFYHNSRIRLRDITDGTSQTFMVGQHKTEENPSLSFGGDTFAWFSTWVGVVPNAEASISRVLGVADHVPNDPAHHQDDFSGIYDSGAHFCYCDGSVSFISEYIDKAMFQALATRDKGDIVSMGE